MKNLEIAGLFYRIADILELKEVKWKPQAYRNAARSIEALGESIEEIAKRKELEEIPGVGKAIGAKIEEYLKTGKIKAFERLNKGMPKELDKIMQIEGIGAKKAYFLYKRLGIGTIKQLENAVKKHRIEKLPGFGAKSGENIANALQVFSAGQGRMLLGLAMPLAEEIMGKLESLKGIDRISAAGSLRRMQETIGDIDILVTAGNAEKVMDYFAGLPDVMKVLAKGRTKTSVILSSGVQADVRVLKDDEFGSALQYFTGSKEHNIKLREIAIRKGMKLSEYGLFSKKTGEKIAGRSEEEIYNRLGMEYIEPELRTNSGELQAALEKRLPNIIRYDSVKGDVHIHTKYSDGSNGVMEMAEMAKGMGYEWICITDHSKSERIANGMDEETLERQIREIKAANRKIKGFRAFSSCEVDILPDGELDFDDSVLKKLDFAVIGVHSRFRMPREEMTERVLRAMDSKYARILAHPTGRLIGQREGYEIDMQKIMEKAVERNVLLEINAAITRLDLNDTHIRQAVENGVKLAIGTDAHSTGQMRAMKYGIAMARRGWAERKDIVNVLPLEKAEKVLKV